MDKTTIIFSFDFVMQIFCRPLACYSLADCRCHLLKYKPCLYFILIYINQQSPPEDFDFILQYEYVKIIVLVKKYNQKIILTNQITD